jgi:tRNA A37 methylthiotransferase MiaB
MRFDRMGAFAFFAGGGYPGRNTAQTRCRRNIKAPTLRPPDAPAGRHQPRNKNEQRVGTAARVLVTNAGNGMYTGRSEYEAPGRRWADFIFTSAQPVAVGTFADVRIERADTYDLFWHLYWKGEKTL